MRWRDHRLLLRQGSRAEGIGPPLRGIQPFERGHLLNRAAGAGCRPVGALAHSFVQSQNASGTYPIGTGVIAAKNAKTFTFPSVAASRLVNGQNELVIVCSTDYMYLVNDFTIDYPALFVARSNVLEFTLPIAPDVQTAMITGFSVDSGYLVDVTDPRHPLYEQLTTEDFAPDGAVTGSPSTSRENGTAPHCRRHGAGSGIPGGRISVDAPSQLRESSGAYNVIVVSHKGFIQRFGEYVDRRKAQGYRVITTDVEDVYDEFNGGRPSAHAIKRFIKYGLDHWGVEFVILVGTATRITSES